MDPSWCSGLQDKILISGDIYLDSGESWMYPYPNVPLWEIPPQKKNTIIWVFPFIGGFFPPISTPSADHFNHGKPMVVGETPPF